MHYFITGGAGFIGGHLTESLLGDGHRVTVIDDFSTGSRDNLAAVADNPNLEIIEADIVNSPELLLYPMRECDAVFHLAAAVGVELVVHDPVRTIMTNVRGTENVLRYAGMFRRRVIVASTSEVYGKSVKAEFSEDDDLLIGSPGHSRWCYACSKLLDEFYVMAFCGGANLPGTVVRFFNTVGPRQSGRYGMVVPRFVNWALKNEPLQVYGDGEQSRCFCHVFDVVRALRLLVDRPDSTGNIYNIGSSELVTMNQLAKRVVALTGSASEIRHLSYEEAYEKGFEDMRRRKPDTSKIQKLTGWQPELGLDRIISDVAACLK